MIVKLRSRRAGDHVHDQVYVGEDEGHLAYAGTLIFRVGEWQEFGAALKLGSQRMKGRFTVILEGDDEVTKGGE